MMRIQPTWSWAYDDKLVKVLLALTSLNRPWRASVGAGALASDRGSHGASVCGSVTVPGVARAARIARSRAAQRGTNVISKLS